MAERTKPGQSQAARIKALQAENAALKRRLKVLSAVQATPVSHHPARWRSVVAAACVCLTIVLLFVGNILFWSGNTLISDDAFKRTVEPVIRQTAVQEALAEYTADELFDRVDIEAAVAEALPPKADFAAPAIAQQLKSVTKSSLQGVLRDGGFQKTVNASITGAHDQLIGFIKDYEGDGTIDVTDTFNGLVSKLDRSRFGFLSDVKLPRSVGSVVVVEAGWLPAAHNVTNNIGLYRILTSALFVICSVAAVWVSRNKRRTVLWLGGVSIATMLATLITVRLAESGLIGYVESQYQAAARSAADILLQPLIVQSWTLLLTGVLIVLVAWLSGPYKTAVAVRGRIRLLLDGRAHEALIGSRDNEFTRWLGTYRTAAQWTAIGIGGFLIVMMPASLATTLWTVAVVVLVIVAIEIVAAPPHKPARARR